METKKVQAEDEESLPTSTTPLLLNNINTSSSQNKPTLLLNLITCMSLITAITFSLLFFSLSPPSTTTATARHLNKLHHPTVILISSDGFRFGYQHKTSTPNIHRLITNGTEALTGLIPVFPTLTFPNHYSIVTGLYPPHHGIINNFFFDPVTGEKFTMASHESKWWLGQPLWQTVVNSGKIAATYFWPGSEVKKGSWTCDDVKYCKHYNGSVSFEDRVDTVLDYFDLDLDDIPVFMTLYFEDPDHQGHQVGPDDDEVTQAVARIDGIIGRLIHGLEKRGVFEDVSIIMVGDHGMVGTCDQKLIFLDDLASWVEIKSNWVHSYSPLLAIWPPSDSNYSLTDVVAKMNEGLSSGKVENGNKLKVFLKEDLPKRLHYAESDRIPPIIGLVHEGYKVEQSRTGKKECGGAHGYDNEFFSMRTIFIGHGPQFERGKKIPSFENVEIYNLITSILNIKGAPNNGSDSFPQSVLLPKA
ncbi:putative nucleotide diphosphatase [Medicago truncatula]|uniref:Ectonucleotide pyrophosphatase/phosphodiesterase n=1 Tax=Medicago truncatula TaxID=3880 RepID=G7KJV4_MEDTR|nr:ectonucleotide pyrophosphatase/phosphodiesterase family member 1 [Medicago truncatula]AES77159.1 ectonucleotide pyrophosphatase/phosphodiesterase [Medicago truncatula]RHN53174.1 putative nucleotide diphosphatase [Medicago truncatula]